MVIQHNASALIANGYLDKNTNGLKRAAERLSSGYRINRSADDAAGLAVSEKLRSQIIGIKQSIRNSADGVSLIQTFEGALGETVSIIHRAKELAVQAANGEYQDDVDREAIEMEYLQLCDEVNQIAETDFNGLIMLTGKKSISEIERFVNERETAVDNAVNAAFKTASSAREIIAVQEAITPKTANSVSIANISRAMAGGTTCGDFTVYGNSSDYSFDNATGVLTILGGDVTVEGTGAATTNTIVVAKDVDANVTLRNVNIDVSNTGDEINNVTGLSAFEIEDNSNGNITVILEGDNTLKSGVNCAGLQKNGGTVSGTLNIDGSGSLKVEGGYQAAGIGGGNFGNVNNIIINGGSITSIGGSWGAGIGGGWKSYGNGISITGGNITATGGHGASGIGGGTMGNGTNITISGGTVTSNGGYGASGIGGGAYEGDGINITISGGTVTAKGYEEGVNEGKGGGAGIGGGINGGDGINITISGGIVTGIGGTGGCLVDGTVISVGGAGIGGGSCAYSQVGTLKPGGIGNVIITGEDTVVVAKGGLNAEDIGSGMEGPSATVTIDGILTKESYSDAVIVDGTIVHYKPIVSTRPNRGEAEFTYADSLILQVGARSKDGVNFTFKYNSDALGDLKANLDCTASGLGMDKLTLSTQEEANFAIDQLDFALAKVSMVRSNFGAAQNRLEHKISNLTNSSENLTQADSTLRDTDMALEMMNYTKSNILKEASQAMLSQANQMPQSVLSLISG